MPPDGVKSAYERFLSVSAAEDLGPRFSEKASLEITFRNVSSSRYSTKPESKPPR